ncbi:hypothetical protein V2J52_12665 [Georgenia sp. MJ173]|uniref:hypothetical protein n=1 Tax=Georgenia sunbinii TaxID=3117728 RepID=UPI002F260EB5
MSRTEHGPTRIAASLWSVPVAEQEARATQLAAAGLRRWHWDHSDGTLGAAGGFTPQRAARLNALTGLPGEAHLMVADPVAAVPEWAAVCDTIIVHIEATGHEVAVELIRGAGRTAVLAVSPDTPLPALESYPDDVGILVMAVEPGQAGSTFRSGTLARLRALRGRELLGVDGSVNEERARACVANGATWVISGTDLCTSHDPAAWIADLDLPHIDEPPPLRGAHSCP